MSLVVASCRFSSSPISMVAVNFVQREQGRSFGLEPLSSPKPWSIHGRRVSVATACVFDPTQKPILKEALKEPVAFMGGMFAGLLRLDLNEDPLKEWVTRTVEASGVTEEEIGNNDAQPEEVPEQIVIE